MNNVQCKGKKKVMNYFMILLFTELYNFNEQCSVGKQKKLQITYDC